MANCLREVGRTHWPRRDLAAASGWVEVLQCAPMVGGNAVSRLPADFMSSRNALKSPKIFWWRIAGVKSPNPRSPIRNTALGSDGQGPNGLLSFFWIFSILFDFV